LHLGIRNRELLRVRFIILLLSNNRVSDIITQLLKVEAVYVFEVGLEGWQVAGIVRLLLRILFRLLCGLRYSSRQTDNVGKKAGAQAV
jgi:hypothetical protein